jgi:hypothetical protein
MLTNSNYNLFLEYAKKVPREQIIGGFDPEGNFYLYKHEVKLISKTYKIFYINTLQKDLQVGPKKEYNFTPRIDPYSDKLAMNFRRKMLDDSERIGPDHSPRHKFTKTKKRRKSRNRL